MVVLIAVTTTTATAAFAPRKPCGAITGPRWTFLKGPETGAKYAVLAIGSFPCAAARTWVAKLVADRVKNKTSSFVNNNVLANGPKGYACAAHSSKEGRAFAGACGKGPKINPTSGFSWSGVP
jgi:hypothetical protein